METEKNPNKISEFHFIFNFTQHKYKYLLIYNIYDIHRAFLLGKYKNSEHFYCTFSKRQTMFIKTLSFCTQEGRKRRADTDYGTNETSQRPKEQHG